MPEEPIPPAGQPAPAPVEPPPAGPQPPPVPPRKSRAFGSFTGGCVLTCVAGAVLALILMWLNRSGNPTGCAFIQLVYVIPVVIWLLKTRRNPWALGVVFGGAVVLLLGSICADIARTGFH